MREITYGFVKPDAYGHRRAIERMIARSGLEIVYRKDPHYMTRPEIAEHYEVHQGKPFFNDLVFSVSGPTDQLIMAGEDAVTRLRLLSGGMDPAKAGRDTIRGRYGTGMPNNGFHSADSREAAARETMLHLGREKLPEEVCDWLREMGYDEECLKLRV